MEEVDMTVAYSHISDEQMKHYLTKEFSIYLSQGCKYNCQFCQACKNTKERYRDLSLLEKELVFLGEKAEKF
ncbi:MAG: hypothetical protein LBO09_05150 [Candidatus Peribacteria bacterium]|nr:hypothetical protein [Candidatus Peribacteria bacterium]